MSSKSIIFKGLTFIRMGWAGTMFNVYKNNDFVAKVEVDPWEKQIHNLEVLPSFRRKGIATIIYEFIEKDFKIKLKPSKAQTKDAKEFWNKRLNETFISFKQFLEEERTERSDEKAEKLLKYIMKRQHSKDQINNIGQKQEKFFTWINNDRWGVREIRPKYDDFVNAIKHNNLQPTDVPVDKIVTYQDTVSGDVVDLKIKGKWPDHEPDFPFIYKYHNVYVLVDGNHRLSVARLKRQKYLKAYVLNAKV